MIPDAVAAVIAATLADHPAVAPERVARIAVDQLREQGWQIIPARRPPARRPAA